MNVRMTRTGLHFSFALLFFTACTKEKDFCTGFQQQAFHLSNFKRIKAGDNLKLSIRQGTAFSILAEGCANTIADLDLTIGNGEMLQIDCNTARPNHSPVTFTITMPTLVHLVLTGKAKASLEGFAGQTSVIRTILSGEAECLVSGTAINANFDLSGASKLTLFGNTESLYGNISGTSVLNSFGVVAEEVDMEASGSATAYVFPQTHFFAAASGTSRIYYKGNPANKHLETSGAALITQQD